MLSQVWSHCILATRSQCSHVHAFVPCAFARTIHLTRLVRIRLLHTLRNSPPLLALLLRTHSRLNRMDFKLAPVATANGVDAAKSNPQAQRFQMLDMDGYLNSPNCDKGFRMDASAIVLDMQQVYTKARSYALAAIFTCILQLWLLWRQLQISANQVRASSAPSPATPDIDSFLLRMCAALVNTMPSQSDWLCR